MPEMGTNVGEGLEASVVGLLLGLADHHLHAIGDEGVFGITLNNALCTHKQYIKTENIFILMSTKIEAAERRLYHRAHDQWCRRGRAARAEWGGNTIVCESQI